MGNILINYEEVYSKTKEMKSYIENDLFPQIENEYTQIQSALDKVDGAANTSLIEEMQQNKEKTIMMAKTLYKIFAFIEYSAMEFEQKDKEISDSIAAGATKTGGGEG